MKTLIQHFYQVTNHSKKFINLGLLFFLCPFFGMAQNTNGDTLDISTMFSLDNDSLFVESIVPYDLNSDGYEDLLITIDYRFEANSVLYFVPGSESGFTQEESIILLEGGWIRGLSVGDWNGDLKQDIIMSTQSGTKVYLMDGLNITETLDFSGSGELSAVADMDLDGRADVIYATYNKVTVGYNQGDEIENVEITDEGRNAYRVQLLDLNQDGFQDIIVDNETENRPVVYMNQQDRSFIMQNVGLPEDDPEPEYGGYYQYKPILFNDDIYPDLLVNREEFSHFDSTFINTRPASRIYLFDAVSNTYVPSDFRIDTLSSHNFFHTVHINNDGYVDFFSKDNEQATVVENQGNNSFNLHSFELPSEASLWDLTNVDADQDGDTDILFSEFHKNKVYILRNNDENEFPAPVSPAINSLDAEGNAITITWKNSLQKADDYPVPMEYGLVLSSENGYRLIGNINPQHGIRHSSKVLAGFQNNQLTIPNLPEGEYTVSISAYDQVGKFSGLMNAESKSVVVSNEKLAGIPSQIKLLQNYPNPFNPTTIISYELPAATTVTLIIFDMLGRKVATLINERVQAGLHEVQLDASNLSSGIYIYQLQSEEVIQTKKMLLIK